MDNLHSTTGYIGFAKNSLSTCLNVLNQFGALCCKNSINLHLRVFMSTKYQFSSSDVDTFQVIDINLFSVLCLRFDSCKKPEVKKQKMFKIISRSS